MNLRLVRHGQLFTKKVVRHTCNFNTHGPKKWYGTCRQAVLVTTGLCRYFRPRLPHSCGLKWFVFMQNKEKLQKIAKKQRENTKNAILVCRVTIL